jgi:hypothetical protein
MKQDPENIENKPGVDFQYVPRATARPAAELGYFTTGTA